MRTTSADVAWLAPPLHLLLSMVHCLPLLAAEGLPLHHLTPPAGGTPDGSRKTLLLLPLRTSPTHASLPSGIIAAAKSAIALCHHGTPGSAACHISLVLMAASVDQGATCS